MKLTTGSLTLMEIHIWSPSEKMIVKEQVRQMRERERERESKLTFGVVYEDFDPDNFRIF